MEIDQIIKINIEKFDKSEALKLYTDPKKFKYYKKTFLTSYIRSIKFKDVRNNKKTIEFLEHTCFEVMVSSIISRVELIDNSRIEFIQNHLFEPLTAEIKEHLEKLESIKPKILITDNSIEFIVNEETKKEEL